MKAKAKILIVEDERIVAEEIRRMLEYMGYNVSSIASSGENAVKEFEEKRPDLILMDIKLRGKMDGVEAATKIREHADIPVIYITALSDKKTLERTKATEPFGYVHKPIEEKELYTALEMALLRHKMDRKLKESEEKYRDLVEKAGIGILIHDKAGSFKYFNKRLLELFGYTAEEMKKLSIQEIVHPEDFQRVMKFHKGRIGGRKVPSRYEFKGIKKDGTISYVEVDAIGLKEGDEIIGTRSYLWDVTERKHAEEELKESEEKFRNIFENASDGMVYLDNQGRIVDVNEIAVQIFGGSKKELRGKHFSKIDVFQPKILPILIKGFNKALKRKICTLDNIMIKNKKGEEIHMESSATPLKKNNKIAGLLIIVRDITERKKAEEELMRLSTAVRMSKDSIVLSDINGDITDVNEATLEMYGTKDKKDLIGKYFVDLIAPEDQKKVTTGSKEALEKGYVKEKEYHVVVKDGRKIPVEMSVAVMKDAYNRPVGFVAISRDITERKKTEEEREKLQEQLIYSEKMAGIGTLTSGFAHEFNNLLQIIKGHTEYARKTQKPQDIQEAFDIVISNTERARKIVRDLQAFANQKISKKERIYVTDLIESVLALTAEHFEKHNIKIVKKYKSIPLIKVNSGKMEQVFLHIVTNARDAMLPEGGKLEIEVRKSGQNIVISFSDTGKGIIRKNLGKIFEPFYTTKGPAGKSEIPGIGLGLSVSYGIVKRHGGTIDVESKIGRGTTFTIRLPIEKERQKRRGKASIEKSEVGSSQPMNILVVDDEVGICRMLTKWLSLEGHYVEYSLTGKEAINLARGKHFDLVFLDVVMPGMPSTDILEKMLGVSPDSDVVIITGKLIDKDLFNHLKQKGASGFLQKPFKLDDVMKFFKT